MKIIFSFILILSLFSLAPLGFAEEKDQSAIPEKESPPQDLNQSLTQVNKSRRSTEFEWSSIKEAKSYEIEITPIERKDGISTPFLFKTEKPIWNGELKPGKYAMRLRSHDKRGVPGDWSKSESFYVKLYAPKPTSPIDNVTINSNEIDTYDLKLKWEEQSEASRYVIHIEDDTKGFLQDIETNKFEVKLKVPVARKYQWSIKGFDKEGNEGEPIEGNIPFTVIGKKLETPKITYPETIFVRQLSWKNINLADYYTYTLYKKTSSRQWKKFKENKITTTQLIFDPSWKGGEYKLTVQAHANLRESSNTYSINFEVANGARTPAAEHFALLRKSIDRTNDWYFIASYLITQITYSSTNWDHGSSSRFQGLGGTGRLGMGFLDKNSPYGFLGIIDYSGFLIDNKNYKYPSTELHGIYRWVSTDAGEFRASAGAYYKELPEIISDINNKSVYTITQIKAFGFHAGGEYWLPINSRLGLQANGRIYLPLQGSAPGGKSPSSEPSYQLGLLGSLRLNTKTTGLAGMAYRKDVIKYKVSDSAMLAEGHQFNESSVVGTYLNFYLEWDI